MYIQVRAIVLFLPTVVLLTVGIGASSTVDELPDITGGAIPVITYDPQSSTTSGGHLFGGQLSSRQEVRYLVSVRNQSGDPIEADSLIIVVQKVQEMSRLRDVTNQVDLPDADGRTEDGKPFFYVPVGESDQLEPYGETEAILIVIRNNDFLRLYPPVLRVRGVRRTASQDYQDALQDSLDEEVRPPPETPQSLYHLQALLVH